MRTLRPPASYSQALKAVVEMSSEAAGWDLGSARRWGKKGRVKGSGHTEWGISGWYQVPQCLGEHRGRVWEGQEQAEAHVLAGNGSKLSGHKVERLS